METSSCAQPLWRPTISDSSWVRAAAVPALCTFLVPGGCQKAGAGKHGMSTPQISPCSCAGSSLQHHLLASYKQSLAAVCAAQLHAKGYEGSARKVVSLLERGSLQVALRSSHLYAVAARTLVCCAGHTATQEGSSHACAGRRKSWDHLQRC